MYMEWVRNAVVSKILVSPLFSCQKEGSKREILLSKAKRSWDTSQNGFKVLLEEYFTFKVRFIPFFVFRIFVKMTKNKKISCTVFAWKWQLILVTSSTKLMKSERQKMKWTRQKKQTAWFCLWRQLFGCLISNYTNFGGLSTDPLRPSINYVVSRGEGHSELEWDFCAG